MSVPNFNAPISNPFGLTDVGFRASPTLVDIDDDGDLDVIVGEQFGYNLYYQNIGTASSAAFAAPVTNAFGLTTWNTNSTFADIDGDGDLDMFVGEEYGNTLYYKNTGNASSATFAAPVTNAFGLTDVGWVASPTFVDIDNDGDLDVFVGNYTGNTLYYQNTGTASSAAFAAPVTNAFGLTKVAGDAHPTFADIDGDGDFDVFVGEIQGNTLYYQNIGTSSRATFAAPVTNPFGLTKVVGDAHPTFADIDGDGRLDAFVGSYYGITQLFLNVPNHSPVLSTPATLSYIDTAFVDTLVTKNGTLAGSDVDAGSSLTYGITGGTNNGATVSKSNAYGTLTVTKATGAYSFVPNSAAIEPLAVNKTNSTLIVTVSDNGSPILSSSKHFTVTITQSGVTETIGNDTLIGNVSNNTFNALAGSDVINGGLGADSMTGGLGNDTYTVDNTGDTVIETSTLATEIDTVNSAVTYTLSDNVENLTLTGTAAIYGTGNPLNNVLTGNATANILIDGAGNDLLSGGAGNDILIDNGISNDQMNGGAGADLMLGGLGNDTYTVNNVGDTVTETSTLATEIDLVNSSVTYILSANVEKLTLTGTMAINGTGNGLKNVLTGNTANNSLTGGNGSDTLIGGLGKDTVKLTETTAATDIVRIAAGDSLASSFDVVTGFKLGTTAGVDKLDLPSKTIAANVVAANGVDAGVIHSHHINSGLINFDDINTYTTPLTVTNTNLANVFSYLQTNIANGNTVAFVSGTNTFVFQGGSISDTVVELVGVTDNSINTTGLAAGAVWIS